ncbi:MAG: Ig-like domain-containing protein, partial [Bacteroidota bacterium]
MSGTKPKWWLGALAAVVLLAFVQAEALAGPAPDAPVPEKTPTNDSTPTWTWNAVAGATNYWVYLDDAMVADVTTPTYTHGTPLSEGLHYLQVTAWVEGEGTESPKSAKGWVEIDLTPPAAPVMDALPAYVNGNNLTFDWSGPGDAATYAFYWRTDGTGAWAPVLDLGVATHSVDISGVTDGVLIEGKVVAYDAAGNASAESGVVFTRVDRTRPTVSAVTPTATLTTNNPRPLWSWAGADALSGVKGYWVTLDAELPVWTTGTAFVPSSNLVDGPHTVIVTAEDNAGNESLTLSFPTVVVDTTPPQVPGAPSTGSPTTDTTPTWSWDAVVGAASYNVYLDGSATRLNSAPITTLSSVVSFTHTDPLPEGEHRLQVTSVDDVGNESDRSLAGTVVVDLTGPVAPLVTQLPQYTGLTSLPFAWSAPTDAVSYTFYYNIAGAPTWASITSLSSPAYTMDISGATDGTVIRAKVVAYDAAGNASLDSNIVTTTVDRTPPTVTATDPTAPLRTKDKTPTWQWSGSDALSGIASYLISLDGGASEPSAATSFTPAYELPDGPHVLTVKALDAAGNESTVLTFETVTVDTTPPPVPSMPLTASPTNDQTPTWIWNDLGAGVGYNVYLDGAATSLNAAPLATNSFTHAADLAEGEHYLQVTSLDDLGNESAPSEAGYVTVDVTSPAAPVMTALSPYTKDTAVTFAWSGTADSAAYTFSHSDDGGASWTDVPGLANSTYAVDISAAADGDVIQGRVTAYDAAGNPSAVSNTVSTMVDRSGPVITPTASPVSPTTNSRPTWSWIGNDDIAPEVPGSGIKGYWVTLDGEPPIWTTGTSFTPSSDLASGGHVLKVKGVDNLDSEGEEVIFSTVLIDTVPPAAPAIAALDAGYNALPVTLNWNAVTDGANAISYVLEWAD